MKKVLLLSAVILLVMTTFFGCSKKDEKTSKETTKKTENVQSITTDKVKENQKNKDWVIVDTRQNDAFNGWKLDGVKRGGHIDGAVDFSANWLTVDMKTEDKEKKLSEALKTKGIDTDKNVVLYDANGKDATAVATYLEGKGYKKLYLYDVKEWAKDNGLPMVKYKNYKEIVPAQVVKQLLDGNKAETFENAKEVKMVESSWGEEKESYVKGHIPTAFHINTDSFEPPPEWMLDKDANLAKWALENGFKKMDTVVVSSQDQMAAYRLAVVLRYIGIEDVRVLNGGTGAWLAAGYKLEETSNKPVKSSDFGGKIPGRPDLIDTIPELKEELKKPDQYTLVDNRSWKEYIGEESGYSYVKEKGRIPGAVYGYAGTDNGANSMDYYRNIDNTMRNSDEIKALWKDANIDLNKHLMFSCGSGWRAAEILTYANVMGLESVSLYSNGWIGWSFDKNNPREIGEPKK